MNRKNEKAETIQQQDRVSAGELQKKNELLTALFDYSVKLGYIPFTENFYSIAAHELKRIFGAFGVIFSTYNADSSELVLQYSTFSEFQQSKAGKLFGHGLEGMHFKISTDIYNFLTTGWAQTFSSLYEVTFGGISPSLCKLAEKTFRLGWFSGICLQDMNTVVGTVVIIGRKGTNPPAIEELKGFSGVTAIAFSRWLNEQKALLTEMKYKSLAENMKDILWQSDIFSKITYISPSITQILGYKADELLNRSFFEIVSPESLASISSILSKRRALAIKRRQKDSITYEVEVFHSNGKKFWVEVVSNPVYDHVGKLSGYQGVAREISERKAAEAEIRLQYERLASLNAEKDKFFSIIAHDLKGALNGFLGYSTLMADRIQNLRMDKLEEYSVTIRKIGLNLNELLENLLEWSVMQRNHVSFIPEELNFSILLEKCIGLIEQQASNKEITIMRNISPNLMIVGDYRMVTSIIRNLVLNAVKFTNRKGKVKIYSEESINHFIEVRIQDNGIGMNEDTLSKLFRIDSVMHEPGTEGESSTGLGLILCKEYIAKHNGKIWFESEIDKGTCVHFTLPMRIPDK